MASPTKQIIITSCRCECHKCSQPYEEFTLKGDGQDKRFNPVEDTF
ncbi:MAG TPA: hypothetical protein VFJ51_06130 [Nitrososphaeraceae archaeon]|nr:hypothetical protein [Nitrososphaeraceae archaeon]